MDGPTVARGASRIGEASEGRTDGIWRKEDEEAIGYVEMDAKSRKLVHFIKLIKQCKELASTTRDTGKFLRRMAVTMWEHGEEDLSEWSERKGDSLYQLANFYEKRDVICSHGGFELVVDKLVSCCSLLLTCSVISLIIVPLDVGYCTLHSIYLSLSDCIS